MYILFAHVLVLQAAASRRSLQRAGGGWPRSRGRGFPQARVRPSVQGAGWKCLLPPSSGLWRRLRQPGSRAVPVLHQPPDANQPCHCSAKDGPSRGAWAFQAGWALFWGQSPLTTFLPPMAGPAGFAAMKPSVCVGGGCVCMCARA